MEQKKQWETRWFRFTYEHRVKNSFWGRFGGGWQWKLGFQASEGFRTVIVNLLMASVRFYWKPAEER